MLFDVRFQYAQLVFFVGGPPPGLERLQQLLDALSDDGQIVRQHVYRVNDDLDAFMTLQRLDKTVRLEEDDESGRETDQHIPKHILIDLPTSMSERLLSRQVCDTFSFSL